MLTNAVTSPTPNPSAAANDRADLGKKEIFLKLLVAQMQHQDPLNPQDPTEMSSQLAQFNTLEQQIRTNQLLAQYLKQTQGGGQSADALWLAAASTIGRSAVVTSERLYFDGVNPASFQVHAKGASSLRIEVRASDGAIVRSWNASPSTSDVWSLSWDGRSDTGAIAPAGIYRIVAMARNANGVEVPSEVRWQGVITAARREGDTLGFRVGKVDVPADAIRELMQ